MDPYSIGIPKESIGIRRESLLGVRKGIPCDLLGHHKNGLIGSPGNPVTSKMGNSRHTVYMSGDLHKPFNIAHTPTWKQHAHVQLRGRCVEVPRAYVCFVFKGGGGQTHFLLRHTFVCQGSYIAKLEMYVHKIVHVRNCTEMDTHVHADSKKKVYKSNAISTIGVPGAPKYYESNTA